LSSSFRQVGTGRNRDRGYVYMRCGHDADVRTIIWWPTHRRRATTIARFRLEQERSVAYCTQTTLYQRTSTTAYAHIHAHKQRRWRHQLISNGLVSSLRTIRTTQTVNHVLEVHMVYRLFNRRINSSFMAEKQSLGRLSIRTSRRGYVTTVVVHQNGGLLFCHHRLSNLLHVSRMRRPRITTDSFISSVAVQGSQWMKWR
jgi:hypothetical protein